nr:unnamed protein product [Callosobruchus analis]
MNVFTTVKSLATKLRVPEMRRFYV